MYYSSEAPWNDGSLLWHLVEREFSLDKVPTIFHVICKLHYVCMDRWTMNHHTSASLGWFSDFSDVEAPPFSVCT